MGDARTWLAQAHAWAHEQLRRRLGEPAASVVSGELWGERAAIPPALRAEFQETGTVHVLVTAGLHLGAVTALVTLFLAALAMPRALTCAVAIAIVWLFVWWSGAQLPAVRAATMATAALAARACGRATFSWNALAIAALSHCFRAAVECCVGVVCALVLLRRRNLCLRGAFRALARRRHCDTRSATRGARAFRRDATGNVAARGGGLSAVRALCGRGKLCRGSLRTR